MRILTKSKNKAIESSTISSSYCALTSITCVSYVTYPQNTARPANK